MPRISFFFMLLWVVQAAVGQSTLPVIEASSKQVKIRDGALQKDNFWVIIPETKPDVYFVDFPRKEHNVTFITDKDSITFAVQFGKIYDFIILLNPKFASLVHIT
jgi:hypothetical protein